MGDNLLHYTNKLSINLNVRNKIKLHLSKSILHFYYLLIITP